MRFLSLVWLIACAQDGTKSDSGATDSGTTPIDTDSMTTDTDTDPMTTDTNTMPTPEAGVVINEFLAGNNAAWEDPAFPGDYPDVLELYNAGDTAVDLTGWTIADTSATMDLPAGTMLAAGAFLVIVANDDLVDGDLFAPFKLSGSGDTLTLTDGSGTVVDTVTWAPPGTPPLGEQTDDISTGRRPDGGPVWVALDPPTIGAAN